MIIEETIPVALSGERLDRIVSLVLDVSRSAAAHLVASGGATVDGVVVASGKIRLTEGQAITVDSSRLPMEELPQGDQSVAVEVVYSDDHIIVVNKSAGLVVHPGAGNRDKTLVNGLLALFPDIEDVGEAIRPGIVHRLDAGTSGLLVVARTQRSYEALVEQLSDHDVERQYLALAWGHFESTNGVIDAPIGRDHRDPLRMTVSHDGKWARTHFVVQQAFTQPAPLSLLTCNLETGRTHQIRVHLAAVDHPVVGDNTYGGARSALVAPRPMLHAQRLAFVHPGSGQHVSFEAPVPADMAEVIARCS